MRPAAAAALLLLALETGAAAAALRAHGGGNPIRRVVQLLQEMTRKVNEEKKVEEDLFEKFMCHCRSGGSDLQTSIETAQARLPQLRNTLDESKHAKAQQDADIKKHKADSAAAQEALDKANALRSKEAEASASASAELRANIEGIGKALDALKKGTEESFLQTGAADILRRLIVDVDMRSAERNEVAAFVSAGDAGSAANSGSYEPKSGEIIGILTTMAHTMEQDLAKATAMEDQSIRDHAALAGAKQKEVNALRKAIEDKLESSGLLGVEIMDLVGDLDSTEATLAEDTRYAAQLAKGCASKQEEWDHRSRLRTEELLAIADAVKFLNDDDALGLFKKTLPSPSFLQVKTAGAHVQRGALEVLHQSKGHGASSGSGRLRVGILSMALRSGTRSFDEVVKMISEMIQCLKTEQNSDNAKAAYCHEEFERMEGDRSLLRQTTDDKKKSLDDATLASETLTQEIAQLYASIKDLDDSVAEATRSRKDDNSQNRAALATNSAAIQVLRLAKERLARFYSPSGGNAEAGVSFLQSLSARGPPPPPPETFGAYQKKSAESGGVLQMLDSLMLDLDKETSELTSAEKEAQAEYEETMDLAKKKRAAESVAITEKEGTKAGLEVLLQKMATEMRDYTAEIHAAEEIIKDLHLECDWLLANLEVREAAREGETGALQKTQAVLSGADYS